MENSLDKTFDAINKLKEVEIELHRLKNALEMMNKYAETLENRLDGKHYE